MVSVLKSALQQRLMLANNKWCKTTFAEERFLPTTGIHRSRLTRTVYRNSRVLLINKRKAPQRASSICQKVAEFLSNRDKARGQITYSQNEGWRFINKAKETFSLRPLVPECKFIVLNIYRPGSR